MKLTKVVAPRLRSKPEAKGWLNETLIANPMSVHPEYRARRSSWRYLEEAIVVLESDAGHLGVGAPIPAHAREIVTDHLARLLVGRDPFDVERLWDQMYRATLPYGGAATPVMALSAVDVALWDLIGKALGQPLWRLLGGRVHEDLTTYATGHDVAAARLLGHTAFKVPMPHGPADGAEGMRRNEAVVAEARAAAGDDADLMIDCYMAWTVEYTVRMARRLEPYRLRWIEEALPPEDVDGYVALTERIASTTIATGEHAYTRWGVKQLLARRACDVLQPDLAWCGGVTEGRRIAALASTWGVPLVPHAGGMQPWTLHLQVSQVNAGLAEVVVLPGEDGGAHTLYPYLRGVPTPADGRVRPADRPGIGVELDEAWLA